ncbi:hypothetical protein [Paenibacillus turicensis]|nr:hypothetical protein [Paenibacillus turicensis]
MAITLAGVDYGRYNGKIQVDKVEHKGGFTIGYKSFGTVCI